MSNINPNAIALVGLGAAVGALLGSWLVGLTIALAISVGATLLDR